MLASLQLVEGCRSWCVVLPVAAALSIHKLTTLLLCAATICLLQAEKYDEQHFGVCPRTLCHGAAVLPVGLSNDLKAGGCTKLFCPHCEEVYEPPAASPLASIDGAAFGPTFAHMLLLTKPQLMLPKNSGVYVPRIFGFKVANQRGRAAVTAAARPPSGALSDDDRSADGAAATAGHGSAAAATAASSSRSFDRAEAIRNDRIGAGIQAALAAASSLSASSVGGGSGSGGGGGSRSGGSLSAVSGSVANYGGVLDAVMARIRRGRPLTSSYPNWQRPKEDDFNDTEDEAMERKRRKLGDG